MMLSKIDEKTLGFPHHHLNEKWDDEDNLYYYRIYGTSVEWERGIDRYSSIEEVKDSGYYYFEKGNGGFKRFLAGQKFCFISYDRYRLKRDDCGIVYREQTPQEKEKKEQHMESVLISTVVLETTKPVVALDTEFVEEPTGVLFHEIAVVDSVGEVVLHIEKEESKPITVEEKTEVVEVVQSVKVVGHSVQGDFQKMKIGGVDIYDIGARFRDERGNKFRLRDLVKFFFKKDIQVNRHNAVEDAYYSLLLLKVFPGAREVNIRRDILKMAIKRGGGDKAFEKARIACIEREARIKWSKEASKSFEVRRQQFYNKLHKCNLNREAGNSNRSLDRMTLWLEYISYGMQVWPVYDANDDNHLYMAYYLYDRGWVLREVIENLLDSPNYLGVARSRFILMKVCIPLVRKDNLWISLDEKGGHNYVVIPYAQICTDGKNVVQYTNYFDASGDVLLLWGTIGKYMMIVDVCSDWKW
jgi:hypothetical protein